MTDSALQVKPTTNLLIPSEYFNQLLYWGEQLKKGSWAIGDITNRLYEIALANKFETTKLEICHAVGRVVGKSGRTIRLYSSTATFYDEEARQKYDVLPFSHLAFATKYGEDCERVLGVALDYFDEFGIPCSVERLAVICGETSPDYHLPPVPPMTPYVPQIVDLPVVREEAEIVGNQVVSEYSRIKGEIKFHLFPIANILERLSDAGDVILAREVAAALVTLRRVQDRLENLTKIGA